jgi:hypothetical protein
MKCNFQLAGITLVTLGALIEVRIFDISDITTINVSSMVDNFSRSIICAFYLVTVPYVCDYFDGGWLDFDCGCLPWVLRCYFK